MAPSFFQPPASVSRRSDAARAASEAEPRDRAAWVIPSILKTLSRDIIVPDNAVRMAHSAATSAETARMEGGLFDAYKAIATSLENVAAMNQPPVFETNTRILANLFEVYTFKTERAYQMLQEHSAAGACGTESLHESFLWAACGAISKMLIGDLAIDEDYESISGWQAPLACARVVLKKESASKSSMLQNLVQLLDWVVRDTTCCFSDASVDAIFGVIQALVCGPASSSYITREMSPGFMTDECGGDVLKVGTSSGLEGLASPVCVAAPARTRRAWSWGFYASRELRRRTRRMPGRSGRVLHVESSTPGLEHARRASTV